MHKRALLFVVASFLLAGCFSSGATPASVVVPKDPTGLSKCKVAKSSASPLVTEWPASYKAHLEGMISDRAVVVSYSGCEMRILDGCRVDGSYKFKRTSLSKDVIEIASEDDLYAKVPLGAASLEGELEAAGRLAIKTTIAGQMKLDGGIPALPESKGCKGATHVIEAMSVGAFELVSGGAVSGRIGVDSAVVGAGAGHKSEESTVRSSGDSDSCKGTKGSEPNDDCRSPIQVFLVPIDEAERAEPVANGDDDDDSPEPAEPAPRAEPDANPEPPPDKSVELEFALPEDGGKWMLLGQGGELLCELPCTRRVADKSGYKLQLDAASKDDIQVVAVPEELGYSPGRHVKGVPQPAYNNSIASVMFYGGILGAVGGLVMVGKGCKEDDDGLCYGGIALTAGAGAIGVAGGIWWYVTHEEEALVMTLVDDESAKGDSSVKVRVGASGLAGSF
jgi:hypothetical protein